MRTSGLCRASCSPGLVDVDLIAIRAARAAAAIERNAACANALTRRCRSFEDERVARRRTLAAEVGDDVLFEHVCTYLPRALSVCAACAALRLSGAIPSITLVDFPCVASRPSFTPGITDSEFSCRLNLKTR